MDNYRDRYVSLLSPVFLGGGLGNGKGLADANHWEDYFVGLEESYEDPCWTKEKFYDTPFDFWRTRDLLIGEKVASLLQKYADKRYTGSVKNIRCEDIWFPTDWNWRREHLGIRLDVDYKKIYEFAKGRERQFAKYLEANFKTVNGWVSRVPATFEKLRRTEYLWDILIEYFLLVSIGYPIGVYDGDNEYMEELDDYLTEDLHPDFVLSNMGICGCETNGSSYSGSYTIYRKA